MNFHRRPVEDPEINLIPLIDVLLVILIFLMITTTYSRFAELHINLPTADAQKKPDRPDEINLSISATGQYLIEGRAVSATDANQLAVELQRARGDRKAPLVVIHGDRDSSLQATVTAMEAARLADLPQVSISTQNLGGK